MKRLRYCIPALMITLMWVVTASAHYNILLLDRSPIQYKLRGTVQLTYARGHLYKREWSKAPRPHWLKAFTFEGMSTDLTAKMKTDGQVTHIPWKVKRPGDTWLVVHLPLQWSEHDAAWVEASVRTIVHVGFSRGWQEPLGMTKVELLPLTRPYGILSGDVMRVQVLDSGKGIANTMVYAEHYYETPPSEAMPPDAIVTRAARTDAQGIATLTLGQPGWWVIMTVVEKGEKEAEGKKGLIKYEDALWVYVEPYKLK